MTEELEALRDGLRGARSRTVGPFELFEGTLEGREVLLAECGVGKVNAAALTQAMLTAGGRILLFTGVAGGLDPELRPGDVVVSRDALQHDVDVTALGYAPAEVPGQPVAWAAAPWLHDTALEVAREALPNVRVRSGRVASGDRFVANPAERQALRDRFGAACAEMEGAAAAQVCARWGVPWVIVRSISDTADGDASSDFRTFTRHAAGQAERVVRGSLRAIPATA